MFPWDSPILNLPVNYQSCTNTHICLDWEHVRQADTDQNWLYCRNFGFVQNLLRPYQGGATSCSSCCFWKTSQWALNSTRGVQKCSDFNIHISVSAFPELGPLIVSVVCLQDWTTTLSKSSYRKPCMFTFSGDVTWRDVVLHILQSIPEARRTRGSGPSMLVILFPTLFLPWCHHCRLGAGKYFNNSSTNVT